MAWVRLELTFPTLKRSVTRASRARAGSSASQRAVRVELQSREIFGESTIIKLRKSRITGFKALNDISLTKPDDVLILIGKMAREKVPRFRLLALFVILPAVLLSPSSIPEHGRSTTSDRSSEEAATRFGSIYC